MLPRMLFFIFVIFSLTIYFQTGLISHDLKKEYFKIGLFIEINFFNFNYFEIRTTFFNACL